MPEFVAHAIRGCRSSRSGMAALEEKGASWRLSPVAPGTMRSPQHLAASHKFPFLRTWPDFSDRDRR